VIHRNTASLLLLLVLLDLPARAGGGLSAPTGLEASDGAYATKVGLSWDVIRNATIYEIFRNTTNDPASAASVGTTPSLIFFDSTAEPAENYFYWVKARDENIESGFSLPDQGFRAIGEISHHTVGPNRPLNPPPFPPENPVTGAKVYLGKTLFWDEQLSSTRTVACGTCHLPRNGGSDPRSNVAAARSTNTGADGLFSTDDDIVGSPGVPLNLADGSYQRSDQFRLREQTTPRKAFPVINAAYFEELLWDGRAGSRFKDPDTGVVLIQNGGGLESQALLPLTEPVEMSHVDADLDNVVARIVASKPLALSPSVPPALATWIGGRSYADLFSEAFGTPAVTAARIAFAIASYERTLYSDRTPLDLAAAEIQPYPPAQQRGREVFVRANCHICHQQSLMADSLFRNIGLRPAEEDEGRFKVTGLDKNLGEFRTPSLRNVALRAPYMHNGRFGSLEEVVEFYDRGGDFSSATQNVLIAPLRLTAQQKTDLVAFLRDGLTDPRVATESGPLFDRPLLYSESTRVPRITGQGSAGSGGLIPRMIAIEPPFAGNPSFTVGLDEAPGGAQAILVIDSADPGMGPDIPTTASLARETVLVAGDGPGNGYASASISIPNDAALIGSSFFGRWFVLDAAKAGGVAASPLLEITVFGADIPSSETSLLSSVSAASLALGIVAPESIVTGFAANLATSTADAASVPLPTTLGGITVSVRDSTGSERLAPLLYCSPSQINYLVPADTAPGEATVSALRGAAIVASGKLQIGSVAPALFTANANGVGIAAALVLRIKTDGTEIYEQVARFDAEQQKFTAEPIDLGPEGDRVFLLLFGTGLRYNSGLAGVSATIGSAPAQVLYAGPQGRFAGLDQMNIPLARALAGRGTVNIIATVDGRPTNIVQVNVGP
jgi:uncharacterized protein (TIGR03437 family)